MSFKQRLGAALYDLTMKRPEKEGLHKWRHNLLQHARGDTLEIGIGTGANLSHYPKDVDNLSALEPNPAMARRIKLDQYNGSGSVEVVEGSAQNIPFQDQSMDTVVSTLVLCSVPDTAAALAEIHRVLRPNGQFLFLEHVASPETTLCKWQDRFDPIWHYMTGDCHLNRRTKEAIEEAGFRFTEFTREPMPSAPSILRPTIRGIAVKSNMT